jgi:hypothetical protein
VTERNSPLDLLLDLLVYAPVGLALVASEELPKLAARGRAQIGGQVNMARVLGQFAVAQGRRQLASRRSSAPAPVQPPGDVRPPAPRDTRDGGQTAETPSGPPSGAAPPGDVDLPSPVAPPGPVGLQAAGPAAVEVDSAVPGPSGLAIPGYDSLAASQVVPRLAGLSAEELAAVAAYESAHRGRRTILTRIQQLQER